MKGTPLNLLNLDPLEPGNFWAHGLPNNMRITLRTALLTIGFSEDYECTRFCGKTNLVAEHKTEGRYPSRWGTQGLTNT